MASNEKIEDKKQNDLVIDTGKQLKLEKNKKAHSDKELKCNLTFIDYTPQVNLDFQVT